MKPTIEFNTKVHVKLTGPMEDMAQALSALHSQGWHTTRSGPMMLVDCVVDPSKYEIHAEHQAYTDQHQFTLAAKLQEVLP